jgi:hypothetical protein
LIESGVKIADVGSLPREREAEEDLDELLPEIKPDKKNKKTLM